MKFLRKLFLQTWGTNEKNTFLNIVGTEKNPPFYSIGSVRTQPWPIWQFIKTRRTIWPTIFVGLALSFQIPDDGQLVAGVCEPHAVSDMRPFHRRAMSQVRSRNPSPPAWTDNKLLNEEGKSLTLSLSGLTESWRRVIITVVDTNTDGQRSLCLQRSSAVTAWLTGRSRYQLITCYCRALRGFIQQEREFHCRCMNRVQNSIHSCSSFWREPEGESHQYHLHNASQTESGPGLGLLKWSFLRIFGLDVAEVQRCHDPPNQWLDLTFYSKVMIWFLIQTFSQHWRLCHC